MPKIVQGVKFQNGIEVIEMPAHHAAFNQSSSPRFPHSSCTRVNSIDRVVMDRHVGARDRIVSVGHLLGGRVGMAGLPVKLVENPGLVHIAAPVPGAHIEETLREEGSRFENIQRLRTNGVIGGGTGKWALPKLDT